MNDVNAANGDVFHLPQLNIEAEGDNLDLTRLAGYARAAHRKAIVGPKAEMRLTAGLEGPDDYSPYGSVGTGLAVASGDSSIANDTYETVYVVSPGDAILGFPASSIPVVNGVRRASVGGDIFVGKGLYMGDSMALTSHSAPLEPPLRPDQKAALARVDGQAHYELAMRFAAENFAYVMYSLAPIVGAFNVEDASLEFIRYLWPLLEDLPTMYWSDDMDGTGVVMAHFLLGWAALKREDWMRKGEDRVLEDVKIGILGAGAGAYGALRAFKTLGTRPENLLFLDTGPGGIGRKTNQMYPLYPGREGVEGHYFKERMAAGKDGVRTPEDAEAWLRGADGLINLSSPRQFQGNRQRTTNRLMALANDPFVLALTNPNPGLTHAELLNDRPDALYGTGDQTKVNGVNNFSAFSFILGGGLMAHARRVTDQMVRAAIWGLHRVAKMGPPETLIPFLQPHHGREFGPHWLTAVPGDTRLIEHEAAAVAMAALDSGVSGLYPSMVTDAHRREFAVKIAEKVRYKQAYVALRRQEDAAHRTAHMALKYPKAHAPLRWNGKIVWDVPPHEEKLKVDSFLQLADRVGVKDEFKLEFTLQGRGGTADSLDPKALTAALERLIPHTEGDTEVNKIARAELDVIIKIALIYPAFGLALAQRRWQAGRGQSDYTHDLPTIFHKGGVMDVIRSEIPISLTEVQKVREMAEAHGDRLAQHPPTPLTDHAPAPITESEAPASALVTITGAGNSGGGNSGGGNSAPGGEHSSGRTEAKAFTGHFAYGGPRAAPKLVIGDDPEQYNRGPRLTIVSKGPEPAEEIIEAPRRLDSRTGTPSWSAHRFAATAPIRGALLRGALLRGALLRNHLGIIR